MREGQHGQLEARRAIGRQQDVVGDGEGADTWRKATWRWHAVGARLWWFVIEREEPAARCEASGVGHLFFLVEQSVVVIIGVGPESQALGAVARATTRMGTVWRVCGSEEHRGVIR